MDRNSILDLGTISRAAIKSKYGVYITKNDISSYVGDGNKEFFLERDIKVNENENSVFIKLKLTNNSEEKISIKSLMVADFYLNCEVDKILEYKWLITSPPKIQEITAHSVKRTMFLKREDNPFSFRSDYGYLENSIVSEWVTKLFVDEKTIFIGATTTDKSYSQIYISSGKKTRIRITCQFDGIYLESGDTIESENVRLFVGSELDSEKHFGIKLKSDMNVNNTPKPLRGIIMSYYYKYNYVNEEMFDEQMNYLEKKDLIKYINCICIDAGYTRYWGDWLQSDSRFKNGLRSVVDRIKNLKLIPCIWVAPLVADPRSKTYTDHREWFLEDREINMNVRFTSPIERIAPNMGLKLADPGNNEFLSYIRKVANEMSGCGFSMFKLDFLYPLGFFNSYCNKRTRVQFLREIIDIFKNAGGRENLILTALSQLSPLVGLSDYARVASDVISPYVRPFSIAGKLVNKIMQKESLKTAKFREFVNGYAWKNDYDCIVHLEKDPYRDNILNEQVKQIFRSESCLWFGDDMCKLNVTQLNYFKKIFGEHMERFH